MTYKYIAKCAGYPLLMILGMCLCGKALGQTCNASYFGGQVPCYVVPNGNYTVWMVYNGQYVSDMLSDFNCLAGETGQTITWGSTSTGSTHKTCDVIDREVYLNGSMVAYGSSSATYQFPVPGTYEFRLTHKYKTNCLICLCNKSVTLNFKVCVYDPPATPPPPTGHDDCGEVILQQPPAQPFITYFWQGTSCGMSDQNPATYWPVQASGTYYLRARSTLGTWSPGCSQITVTVHPKPTANAGNDRSICIGESVTLIGSASGGIAPYSYTWNPGNLTGAHQTVSPTTTTTYTLTVAGDNGCQHSDQVTITVNETAAPPVPAVTLECGQTVLTRADPVGDVLYYWQGNNCQGTSTANTEPSFIATNSGTYFIRAYDPSTGCWSDCTPVNVTVTPIPDIPAVSNGYGCMCDANPVSLTAIPGPNGDNINWYDDSGNLLHTGVSFDFGGNDPVTLYAATVCQACSPVCESPKVPVKVHILPCDECIGTFSPEPGKTYVLSAWVSEDNAGQKVTFENANITLNFDGQSLGPFVGKGPIIEGWQRIEEAFTVPNAAKSIEVRLNNGSGQEHCYVDDIRIHPFDANMKSFVYDPLSLKLVAELDANNYATHYIYDGEGKLTKVKKETIDGIKTLRESRTVSTLKSKLP